MIEIDPIIRIPRAPGELRLGDYVFACRWGDADPADPWAIGHVSEIDAGENGWGGVVLGDSPTRFRVWGRAVKITPTQGELIMAYYHRMARAPVDYKGIADLWRGVFPDARLHG